PPSPHLINGTLHLQTAVPPQYTPSHVPPPQILNGGPPPRTSDHTFPHAPAHHMPSFAASHGSPPSGRDRPTTPREPASAAANGTRTAGEGRTPGGASASPSLRNLLS